MTSQRSIDWSIVRRRLSSDLQRLSDVLPTVGPYADSVRAASAAVDAFLPGLHAVANGERHVPWRRPPQPAGAKERLGADIFTFVGDGLESAIAQARTAAGDQQVTVIGGATVIQALLRAGAVDELEIDIMPVLLRGGLRLFENLEDEIGLERIRVDALPSGRTALRFAVRR